ncbi:MAG: S8 family serine peptidase, partial [Deltaproteobacteria bacterium]|nr:S8 family serine peptidase [Deltaproteobacteria bacterium]
NNNLGISGIAPESKILPLKISESGVPIASAVAEAILYASDHGAKIINLSLQLGGDPQVVTDAVDYAVTNGILLVAAAGQDPRGPVRFPANLENVMAVSAADDTNGLWFNSNYGPEIELTAPGEDIYTTKLGGGHITSSGTSLSAPMVSAVAALIIASHPRFSGEQIRERLITNADDLGDPGWDQYFGHGKVNALKSVKSYPCSAEKIYGEDSEEVVTL